MIITEAKYSADNYGNNICIIAIIDQKQLAVPLDPANRHYAEILKQVELGILTIQEAD